MLHSIPPEISSQMQRLEMLDARDRANGYPRERRLRQIPRETGRFLVILAANAPTGSFVEIGTSAGYSSLWLALACRATGNRLVTFETSEAKAILARETFHLADVEDVVELVVSDARRHLIRCEGVSFCFLDADKEVYPECYELVVPRMLSGGILAADNIISHEGKLGPFVDRAMSDERVDAIKVPIGKGVLVARKT